MVLVLRHEIQKRSMLLKKESDRTSDHITRWSRPKRKRYRWYFCRILLADHHTRWTFVKSACVISKCKEHQECLEPYMERSDRPIDCLTNRWAD